MCPRLPGGELATARHQGGIGRRAQRFVEPGQEREVELVEYAGSRDVYGFRAAIMGPLEATP